MQIPDPPEDLSALAQVYLSPTAPLDEQNIAAATQKQAEVAQMFETLSQVSQLFQGAINTGVSSGGEAQQSSSSAGDEHDLKATGQGYLKVTRICPGWNGAAEPNDSDGYLRLIVPFSETGFASEVWGESSQCRVLLSQQRVLLDAQWILYLGHDLGFHDLGQRPILSQLTGHVHVELTDGQPLDFKGQADFRVLPSGAFEYLVNVDRGQVVYWESLGHRGFRAQNGRFECDFSAKTCTKDNSVSLTW